MLNRIFISTINFNSKRSLVGNSPKAITSHSSGLGRSNGTIVGAGVTIGVTEALEEGDMRASRVGLKLGSTEAAAGP